MGGRRRAWPGSHVPTASASLEMDLEGPGSTQHLDQRAPKIDAEKVSRQAPRPQRSSRERDVTRSHLADGAGPSELCCGLHLSTQQANGLRPEGAGGSKVTAPGPFPAPAHPCSPGLPRSLPSPLSPAQGPQPPARPPRPPAHDLWSRGPSPPPPFFPQGRPCPGAPTPSPLPCLGDGSPSPCTPRPRTAEALPSPLPRWVPPGSHSSVWSPSAPTDEEIEAGILGRALPAGASDCRSCQEGGAGTRSQAQPAILHRRPPLRPCLTLRMGSVSNPCLPGQMLLEGSFREDSCPLCLVSLTLSQGWEGAPSPSAGDVSVTASAGGCGLPEALSSRA